MLKPSTLLLENFVQLISNIVVAMISYFYFFLTSPVDIVGFSMLVRGLYVYSFEDRYCHDYCYMVKSLTMHLN